jgi:hypothetical protein
MSLKEEKVKATLTELLNECLAGQYQDNSFTVTNVDLDNMKFSVDFDIVEVPEDDYIGFQGY